MGPTLLTRSKIKETLEELLFYHSKLNHSFEISWTLWVYKSLRLKLRKEIVKVLSEVNDSVVALVALDLESNGLTLEPFDKTLWRRSLNVDELYSENWLLAYEAVVKEWLSPDKNNARYIDSDPFFNLLRNNGVSFYDASRQLQIT